MGCSASAAASPAHESLLEPPKVEIIGERPPSIPSGPYIDRTDQTLGFQDQCDCDVTKDGDFIQSAERKIEDKLANLQGDNDLPKQFNQPENFSIDKINSRVAKIESKKMENGNIRESKDNFENEIKKSINNEIENGDYKIRIVDDPEKLEDLEEEYVENLDRDTVVGDTDDKDIKGSDNGDGNNEEESNLGNKEEDDPYQMNNVNAPGGELSEAGNESVSYSKERDNKTQSEEDPPSSAQVITDAAQSSDDQLQQASAKSAGAEGEAGGNGNSLQHAPNILIIKDENELNENDEDDLDNGGEVNLSPNQVLPNTNDGPILEEVKNNNENNEFVEILAVIATTETNEQNDPDDIEDQVEIAQENQNMNEDEGRIGTDADQEDNSSRENEETLPSNLEESPISSLDVENGGKINDIDVVPIENATSSVIEEVNNMNKVENNLNEERQNNGNETPLYEDKVIEALAEDTTEKEDVISDSDKLQSEDIFEIRESNKEAINGSIPDEDVSNEKIVNKTQEGLKNEINDQNSAVTNGKALNGDRKYNSESLSEEDILHNRTSPCHETINDILQRPATLIRKKSRRTLQGKMDSDDRG